MAITLSPDNIVKIVQARHLGIHEGPNDLLVVLRQNKTIKCFLVPFDILYEADVKDTYANVNNFVLGKTIAMHTPLLFLEAEPFYKGGTKSMILSRQRFTCLMEDNNQLAIAGKDLRKMFAWQLTIHLGASCCELASHLPRHVLHHPNRLWCIDIDEITFFVYARNQTEYVWVCNVRRVIKRV